MIDYTYADLFKKDNVKKDLILDFGDFQITNNRLYSEAFELSESLCSQNELRFGCCEASVLKFKCRNEFGELKDKWFDVSMSLNGHADTPFQIGSYRVFDSKPSGDRLYTNVTAYDAMYGVINAEMVEWYDGLTFPITMKDFRDSFFAYLGLAQVEIELVNDNILIDKTIDADSIAGKQIITAICELNGVFGHINRQGLFDYVSLTKRKQMIHPGMENVYPGSGIYPGMMFDAEYQKEDIAQYISCEHEDFETQLISKLQIRQEENDIGVIHGTGTNTYIVQDNFLVYGKTSVELKIIAKKLFTKINGVYYCPLKATLRGNPCVEVGDVVVVHTRYKEVESYVLDRTLKGIQALRDTFESKGIYEYEEKVNSVQKEVKRLKGKTNVLERTVEQTRSEIKDVEKGLQSEITQTAEGVKSKVSKGEVVSEINQSAEEVKIKGEKISLEGTVTANENFKIFQDGSMHSKNGTFEGTIKSSSVDITGGNINIRGIAQGTFPINLNGDNGQLIKIGPYWTRMENSEYRTEITNGLISLGTMSGTSFSQNLRLWYDGDITTSGNLSVSGTKSRVAATKSYNNRLLYCYEMPSPIFGDVGHGIVGEDGVCYIDIDQIFFETVDMNQSYQVFLQSYSEHNVYVLKREPQYFVVKGEPNTEFDWELKAKQFEFPTERLEENFAEDDYKETDYVSLADEYLNRYEQEVLNYV